MSGKHTPGPWKATTAGRNTTWVDDSEGKSVVHWQGFDGCAQSKREIVANARLIAAAPELLEAARRIVEVSTVDNVFEWADALDAVKAAIAKAEDR